MSDRENHTPMIRRALPGTNWYLFQSIVARVSTLLMLFSPTEVQLRRFPMYFEADSTGSHNFVQICVGLHPNVHQWHMQSRELTRFSYFFRQVLSPTGYCDKPIRSITLPTAHTEAFFVFAEGLGTNPLHDPLTLHGKGYSIRLLIKAYVLGEMLYCPWFKNSVMSVLDQTNRMPLDITPGDVEYASHHCSSLKCKLIEMLVDVLAAQIRDSKIAMVSPREEIAPVARQEMAEPTTWVELFRRGDDLVIEVLARFEGFWAPGITPEYPAEQRYMELDTPVWDG